nr:glycosyltransferase [Kibdelosporangium sp. MJ126-NF4]CEL14362.1 glycosyl transferase, family 2 [Kibdelosporangium sp. MJ126-NF4]CTQ88728.1 glycosyl transferase, family 2 [Kibdelosporangium sp. MJ126-NF4]
MSELWVVVPAYNEEAGIAATLRALESQQDTDFTTVVVDNGSTDGTVDVVRSFDVRLVHEAQKGTGAAADTGMRHAIASGARWLARTDADCLPAPDWTRRIKAAFRGGLRLVAGNLVPRRDEDLPVRTRLTLVSAVEVARAFGKVRPRNRDPRYLGPYVMAPGGNMAITAELYQKSGGFPRTAIEDLHEDRALVNAVRLHTGAYALRRDVVVYGSSRRVKAWGLRNTLAWYADHRYRPDFVDIR